MQNSESKHIIMVVYDGITNSVFQSMVLQPILKLINDSHNVEITLISFESKKIDAAILATIIPSHNKLHLILLQRLPYIGKIILRYDAYKLFRMLKKMHCHQIIARGPLAGWIVLHALAKLAHKEPERLRKESTNPLPLVTIQARGLCAEEYRYTHQKTNSSYLKQWKNWWIYRSLKNIEFEVYRNKRATDYPHNLTIEVVSPALKEYLVNNFRAQESKIRIASDDLIKHLDQQIIMTWREKLRTQLGIMQDAYVYCYSGSYKLWQCADQTVSFFAQQYTKEPHSFLLILSQDKDCFITAIKRHKIPDNRWLVLNVHPNDLLHYLAIANVGILFREPDIINWVSRPTKMLEYQAAGLKIIHNDTIAWLVG